MTTYVWLDGQRIKAVYEADTDEGLPNRTFAAPPRSQWPAQPSPNHLPHFDGSSIYWVDPRTTAQLASDARTRRDELMAASDWLVTRGIELGTGVPAPWAAYRQALRDLPSQPSFPLAIEWPAPPTV